MPLALFFAPVCLFLGMANPFLQIPPLVIGFPFFLYLLALRADSWCAAFRYGLFGGLAGYAACLYWIVVPLTEQAGMSMTLALPAPLLLGAYMGLYPALVCAVVRGLRDRLPPVMRACFAGALWALLAYARGVLFSGFPWATLPSALAPWPLLLQPLSLMGPYAYAGLLAAIAALFAETVCALRSKQQFLLPATTAVAIMVGCALWSSSVWQAPVPDEFPVRVALVQGNVDQGQKWVPAYQNGTVSRYVEMTQGALAKTPADLIIWPETAMPFYLQEKIEYLYRIRQMVMQSGGSLLVGTPAYAPGTQGRKWDTMNRAYLLTPDGRMTRWYDKEHLVPFGEYLPMGLDLPFLEAFFAGTGDFQTSSATHPLRYGDNLALGVLICYETIFPELAQQRVEEGANLLVNISNDAWFGRTSAPEQHLHQAILRAVEQGRYMVRGTNTGISAIIAPNGSVTIRGPLFRAAVVSGGAAAITDTTPFHYIAPFLPAILAALCILLALPGLRKPSTPQNR